MAREQILSDKRRQRILDRMPKVTTSSMVEEEDAELEESFDEERRSRAPKRAEFEPANVASISDTGDLQAVDYLNLPEPEIVDPRSMSDRDRRRAQVAAAVEGQRYREALPTGGAPKEAVGAMAQLRELGGDALQKERGFEEEYDATTKFQEEEYGEGSIERDRMLAEIMGQEHQTDPDPGGVEGTITDPDLYEKYYFEAQEKTPWAQKEQLQDAAIKGVMAEQAERAALEAEKFPEAEATETVGGGLGYEKTIEELRQEKADRDAAAKKATPVLSDDAKKKHLPAGGAGTRRQPTDTERAAQKVMAERARAGVSDDFVGPIQSEVIEDTVDETTTDEVVDETTTDEVVDEPPAVMSSVAIMGGYTPQKQKAILKQPGGANFFEALDSLGAAAKGDKTALIKFQKLFGDRSVQGGRDESRRKFLSKIPVELRESFGKDLQQALRGSETELASTLGKTLQEELYNSISQLKGTPTDAEQEEIQNTAEQLKRVFLEHSTLGRGGGRGLHPTRLMALDHVGEGKRQQLVNELAEKIQGPKGNLRKIISLIVDPTGPLRSKAQQLAKVRPLNTRYGNIARPSEVFAEDKGGLGSQILAFEEAATLLHTLGLPVGADTTPQIPVAEGGSSSPPPVRTEGSIDDSPVEDIIASAVEGPEG